MFRTGGKTWKTAGNIDPLTETGKMTLKWVFLPPTGF